ncbi:MAG: hypothetical protein E6J41_03170 [Chloroflexi bacterium]|nr:MAG: hypothetical protein E6J41_03170 [Chloroflexota bacterium]
MTESDRIEQLEARVEQLQREIAIRDRKLAIAARQLTEQKSPVAQLGPAGQVLVRAFHQLYHALGMETRLTWLGVPLIKCPLDLWIYQEILTETRPGLIVETGTWYGGSALYLASVLDQLGSGQIVTIDPTAPGRADHGRIRYLTGSSTDASVLDVVRELAAGSDSVMVILDSDHRAQHVLAELQCYADLVTPGCYLIVEDTSVNGHPIESDFGAGPMEAVETFLAGRSDFEVMTEREKGFNGWGLQAVVEDDCHAQQHATGSVYKLRGRPCGRTGLDPVIDQDHAGPIQRVLLYTQLEIGARVAIAAYLDV